MYKTDIILNIICVLKFKLTLFWVYNKAKTEK